MTLYTKSGIPVDAIGKREYWKEYERFRNSPLHSTFQVEIYSRTFGRTVNSLDWGSEIITKIEKETPQIIDPFRDWEVGCLFGMTLKVMLANEKQGWKMKKIPKNKWDLKGMIYIRKKK